MKLKKLSSLICVALAAGSLAGCNFYDEPHIPDDGSETPPVELPPVGEIISVETGDELKEAIEAAKAGDVIGLVVGGDFASMGTIVLEKPLTITSVSAEGEVVSGSDPVAKITGASCFYIPSSAEETLRGGNAVTLANLAFEKMVVDACSSDGNDSQNAIINVGKVGKDKTPVKLSNITIDGTGISEPTGESDAWIYSRGLVNVSDSTFINKSEDAKSIMYLNCDSSASRGGSNSDPYGSKFDNNTFGMATANTSAMTKVATIGRPSEVGNSNKNCLTTFTDNTFVNFAELMSETDDASTALYDVFGDTTESGNILENDGETPPPVGNDPLTTVEEVNAAIEAATVGATVTLAATGVFDSGVITLDKQITLTGEDGATISGSTCIDVVKGAEGATISDLNFTNDAIVMCGSTDDKKEAVINIQKVGQDNMPVILTNLSFDASNITSQEQIDNKGNWIRSYGYFELTSSTFTHLSSDLQNDAIRLTCNSSAGKLGTVIENNAFTMEGSHSKETSAVKIGDSNGGQIKADQDQCNTSVISNTFTNFAHEITSDLSDSSAGRDAAIFALSEDESNNVFSPVNAFN
ncbi:hypothetical protein BCU68_16295 [Vibrio sp. 10N.286.49.B3]|uniref:hypothetical protein n=1 Tax=Vibrio sp. 10N.286.49.B3 TaxID=1880855 RepID=UPI000C853A2B|nr:hypothetical protein [Vibrio sp. 10N.286.49.B3]PMH40329.1 hypothetical protein BCU68_16295 [Vibrio sp. 10N.286.49.B3]